MLCNFLLFVLGNKDGFKKQVGFELTLEDKKTGLASQTCSLGSQLQAPHSEEPHAWFNALFCLLEVVNNFWTGDPTLSFCTGLHELHSGAVSRRPSGREEGVLFKQKDWVFKGTLELEAHLLPETVSARHGVSSWRACGQGKSGRSSKWKTAEGLQHNTKGCRYSTVCTRGALHTL